MIFIELLCSLCFFNSKHDKKHHIIDINKKESLEDNDISYKELISEFGEIFQKAKNLKLKIEKEIEKIDNSYKKIENEIILSFKKRHLELEEKEKNLKLELNLKVNLIKNELEKNLNISSNVLLSCEKTNEIITKYESKINSDINILYLISKINKSKEKADDFIQKKMNNSDISFELDKIYFYNDYYFNGIPAPKNLKVEKRENKLYISWDLDNSNIKSINTNKIKYLLVIKRFGDLFEHRYEISDNFFYFKSYDEKIDYEIKVRTSISNCQSEWSEIKKSKTEILSSSNILGNNNNKKNIFFPSLFSSKNNEELLSGNNSNDNKNRLFGLNPNFDDFWKNNSNKEKPIFTFNPFSEKNENSKIKEKIDNNTNNIKDLIFGNIDNNDNDGDIENNNNDDNNDNNSKNDKNNNSDNGNDSDKDNDNDKINLFSKNFDNKE